MKLDEKEGVEEVFSYHAPTPEQVEIYNNLRKEFLLLAKEILHVIPPSATRTVALRKLWECSMICNAAIATEGKI